MTLESNTDINDREWFATLPEEVMNRIKEFTLETALEQVQGSIEELQQIADALRSDIDNAQED